MKVKMLGFFVASALMCSATAFAGTVNFTIKNVSPNSHPLVLKNTAASYGNCFIKSPTQISCSTDPKGNLMAGIFYKDTDKGVGPSIMINTGPIVKYPVHANFYFGGNKDFVLAKFSPSANWDGQKDINVLVTIY